MNGSNDQNEHISYEKTPPTRPGAGMDKVKTVSISRDAMARGRLKEYEVVRITHREKKRPAEIDPSLALLSEILFRLR